MATLLLLMLRVSLSGHCFDGLVARQGTARPRMYEARSRSDGVTKASAAWFEGWDARDEQDGQDASRSGSASIAGRILATGIARTGFTGIRVLTQEPCGCAPPRKAPERRAGPSESPGRNFQAKTDGSVQRRPFCASCSFPALARRGRKGQE